MHPLWRQIKELAAATAVGIIVYSLIIIVFQILG